MSNLQQIKEFLGMTDEEFAKYLKENGGEKQINKKDGLIERVNKKIIDANSGKQLLREVKYESN